LGYYTFLSIKKAIPLMWSGKEIIQIQNDLNNRPRKTLGYETPAEVFYKAVSRKMVA
jgi:IS30 family transposase